MALDNPTFNADVYYNGTLLGAAGTTATSVTGSSFYTSLTNMGAIVDLSAYDPANAMEAPVLTTDSEGDVVAEYLAPPTLVSATGAITGGSLAAATYYYTVTAVNGNGETNASNVVSVVLGGTSVGSVSLVFTEPTTTVAGSMLEPVSQSPTAYNVYRGTSATVQDHVYSGTNSTTASPFVDTGATPTSTATLAPKFNSATLAGQVVKQ